jgi:hypothetical protein
VGTGVRRQTALQPYGWKSWNSASDISVNGEQIQMDRGHSFHRSSFFRRKSLTGRHNWVKQVLRQ